MEIKDLAPSEAPAVAAFRCASGDRWAVEVEETIHDDVAELVAAGAFRAMGAWIDNELVGLIIWRRYGEDHWQLALLATALDHRGEGAAKALYANLIKLALAEGVRLIFSRVDRENGPMIGLQAKFRVKREVDPNDVDWFLYVLDATKARRIAAEYSL